MVIKGTQTGILNVLIVDIHFILPRVTASQSHLMQYNVFNLMWKKITNIST